MARLHLDDTQWTGHGSTYARGQAWDSTGRLLRALDLAAMFDALPLASDWPKAAAELNGTYAAARQVGNDVRAVVDRIRSIPLFFRNTSSGLEVTDVADRIVNIPESRLNELSCLEFHLTGYTTGCQTLFDDISQVPAGRALITTHPNENRFALIQYYSFEHGRFLTASENEAFDRLDQLHSQVFGRLVRDLQDRPIILPLSGGYDSRLIAIMLREFAARDVRCFCYGAPGNWEIETSRALAEHLGFCWTYVPYGPAIWRRCHEMPAFRDYFRIAGNFSSVPHIQDWPATLTLAERGLLPHDAVFVPGHTGDFLTGNHIPKRFLGRQSIPTEEVVEAVLGAHYCLWNWPDDPSGTLRSSLAARVREVMGPRSFSDLETAASSFERWEWQERQAKFIVNSVRAYENFGHEWRLPWWDAELMDFWSRISIERRGRRRLFLDYMDRRHRLPVPQANADYSATASTAIRLLEHFGLKPGALAMRRLVRNARWRSVYSTDPMGWFALVDIDTFRRRYTGREIGHAFFADMYIDMVRSRYTMPSHRRAADGDASSFARTWRNRFEEFAELRDDDAGIAGWSPSGLATRLRFFARRWHGAPVASLWLDVGCGAGTYSKLLRGRGLRTIGLDYSQPTLAKARARLPADIVLVAGDATQLPFADDTFDGALCFGVLQAVSDSAPVVRELARVLAPGAMLWIDALNRDGIAARLIELHRTLRAKKRHLRYESTFDLERCLVDAGMVDVRLHWLPIAPGRLQRMQPLLDSRVTAAALKAVPFAGRLLSHSFVYSARVPQL